LVAHATTSKRNELQVRPPSSKSQRLHRGSIQ
jgi:hypothetical protein